MELPHIGSGVDKDSFERIVNSVLSPGETLLAVFNGVQEYSGGDRIFSATALEFLCFTDRNIRYTMSALFKQSAGSIPWSEVTGVSEIYGVFRGAIVIHLGSIKRLRFGEMVKDDVRAAKEIIEWGMQGFPSLYASSPDSYDDNNSLLSFSSFFGMTTSERIKYIKKTVQELHALFVRMLALPHEEREHLIKENAETLFSSDIEQLLTILERELPAVQAAEVRVVKEVLGHCRRIGIRSSLWDFDQRQEKLRLTISEFVWEKDLNHKKLYLENHPEIMSDLGFYVLNLFIIVADFQGEKYHSFVFAQNLVLLVRCRQYGIDEAFSEIIEGRDEYWAL